MRSTATMASAGLPVAGYVLSQIDKDLIFKVNIEDGKSVTTPCIYVKNYSCMYDVVIIFIIIVIVIPFLFVEH